MSRILLLETEESSQIEGMLHELGHEVYRVVRSTGSGKNSEESTHPPESTIAPEDKPSFIPDLVIHDEDFDVSTDRYLEGAFRLTKALNIPEVVILKSYDADKLRQHHRRLNYYGFLLRPVSDTSLITVVKNALGAGGLDLFTVINSLNMPFYVLDAETYEIVLANSTARSLLRNGEKTCYELSHHSKSPCSGVNHVCPLQKVKETKEPAVAEHIHYSPEEKKRYVEVFGYPIFDDENDVSHMIEYSIDITERKREEHDIRKLSTAIDQSDNIMLISDAEGRVEFVNRSFELNIGTSREYALGKTVHELATEYEREKNGKKEFFRIIIDSVETESAVNRAFHYYSLDGNEKWENVSVTPIRSDEAIMENYIAVAEDISGQVKQKEELQRAKEEAEKASTMKSRFLANISHEIRTPLNIILGFTDLMLDEEEDEHKTKKLSNVRHAGGNLLAIINDILDFSHIESSNLSLNENAFSPRTLIEQIREMYTVQAAEKNLSFDIRCEGVLPSMVRGDEERILQIFNNLISNAIKFTSEGSVQILCVYHDNTLEAQVIDTGIGIDEARCKEIFSPFEQIDGSTSRKYGGTGLGLALTKKLVEKMGGKVYVQSSSSEGSCFTVTIPLPAFREEEGGMNEHELSESGTSLDESTGRKHILIAEDNSINQKLMRLMVEKMGYTCKVSADGQETMESLRAEPFDVLLLDMHMPVKNGLEVIREIRNDEKLKDVYVISLTASAMKVDQENFLAAGCDDYIAKPVNMNELEEKLQGIREI